MIENIIQGVIIGAAGGFVAGCAVYIIKEMHECYRLRRDKEAVYKYLVAQTEDDYARGKGFKITREIASWCNLTESRVRYVCSNHSEIYLNPNPNEFELWTIYKHQAHGVDVPAELD